MIPMRMVQMTIDQIIDVVAVRDRFVSTSGTVLVIGVVGTTLMLRSALSRIFFSHL